MQLNVINNGVEDRIEKYIIKKTKKSAPKCYRKLKNKTIDKVIDKVKSKFNMNISKSLVISINSSYMKSYIISHYNNLEKNKNKILKEYNHMNILELSGKYDLSPVTILKLVFENKYKMKVSKINQESLDEYDIKQFNEAVKNDVYFQLDQSHSREEASDFEKKVELILIKNKVKFKTQEELSEEQIKSHGKPINTPDFLIQSEFYINGVKINWIDAKNFYGSNVAFIKNKIKKQITKYIDSFGSGCIIFSLGHNKELNILNTLCLDYNSLL
jgi:hypothetical protein